MWNHMYSWGANDMSILMLGTQYRTHPLKTPTPQVSEWQPQLGMTCATLEVPLRQYNNFV